MAQDRVKIGDDIESTEQKFGEIISVSGEVFSTSHISGSIGLAYQADSVDKLPTFMDGSNLEDKSFSFYLSQDADKSYITIPGRDTSRNWGKLNTHKVVEEKYWALQLSNVKNGNKTIDATKYKAIIDSGASVIVGAKAIVDPLIKDLSVSPDCSNKTSLPEITFTIDDIEYPLTADEYILEVTDLGKTECVLGIKSWDFPKGMDYIIFGGAFMTKYPPTFSFNNNTVSFEV